MYKRATWNITYRVCMETRDDYTSDLIRVRTVVSDESDLSEQDALDKCDLLNNERQDYRTRYYVERTAYRDYDFGDDA